MSMTLEDLGPDGLRDQVVDRLRGHLGNRHDPAKEGARLSRQTTHAVRNWLLKRNGPSLFAGLMLAREIPEVRDLFCQAMGVPVIDSVQAERDLDAIRDRLDRLYENYPFLSRREAE